MIVFLLQLLPEALLVLLQLFLLHRADVCDFLLHLEYLVLEVDRIELALLAGLHYWVEVHLFGSIDLLLESAQFFVLHVQIHCLAGDFVFGFAEGRLELVVAGGQLLDLLFCLVASESCVALGADLPAEFEGFQLRTSPFRTVHFLHSFPFPLSFPFSFSGPFPLPLPFLLLHDPLLLPSAFLHQLLLPLQLFVHPLNALHHSFHSLHLIPEFIHSQL